jgi:integrase/recombinase XerC
MLESDNEHFRTLKSAGGKMMGEIVSSEFLSISFDNCTTDRDFLAEFLRLQNSPQTTRSYAASIEHFFQSVAGRSASPETIAAFLQLAPGKAIEVVLRYKADLQHAEFKPATINNRLAAIKSLVNHAQKLGRCDFDLQHVKGVKSRAYRDTTGVEPAVYRDAINTIDRTTTKGKRDYAIARLLWDNALRRVEIERLSIGDYQCPKLWIRGKGSGEKELIDLSAQSIRALDEWLAARGSCIEKEPLFIALDRHGYGKRLSGRSIDRNVVKEFGVETKVLSPHKVRHSTITAALDRTNGDVRKVQKFSRHQRIDTLLIYDDNRLGVQGEVTDTVADLV